MATTHRGKIESVSLTSIPLCLVCVKKKNCLALKNQVKDRVTGVADRLTGGCLRFAVASWLVRSFPEIVGKPNKPRTCGGLTSLVFTPCVVTAPQLLFIVFRFSISPCIFIIHIYVGSHFRLRNIS